MRKKLLGSIFFAISGSAFIILNIAEQSHILFAAFLSICLLICSIIFKFEMAKPCYKNKTVIFFSVIVSILAGGKFCHTMIVYKAKFSVFFAPVMKLLNITDSIVLIALLAFVGACFAIYFCNCIINLILQSCQSKHDCPISLNKKGLYALLLFITFISLLCVSEVSPLKTATLSGDESIFAVVGKGWAHGMLPYSDIFDHKGPIIFLIYAISYLIFDSELFVFILQVFCIWISIVIGYNTVLKFTDRYTANICCCVMAFYLFIAEGSYAITEIFCLPLLMASAYYTLTYFLLDQSKHPLSGALIYGLTISLSLCTRLTNCAGVFIGVLVIFIDLIIRKQYKNLLSNVFVGLMGIAIPLFPFIIYFYTNSALQDAVFGTFIYNVFCVTAAGEFTWHAIMLKLYLLIPLICINIVTLKGTFRWQFKLFILTSGLLITNFVAGGKMFPHYFIITLPYIPMLFSIIKKSTNEKAPSCSETYRRINRQIKCLATIAIIIFALTFGTQLVISKDKDYLEKAKEQVELIPPEDRNSVIAYNVNGDWYLKTDILPCFKYFILQDSQASKSEDMVRENIDYYNSAQAKWVIVKGTSRYDEINKAIASNYIKTDEVWISDDEILTLYKRK